MTGRIRNTACAALVLVALATTAWAQNTAPATQPGTVVLQQKFPAGAYRLVQTHTTKSTTTQNDQQLPEQTIQQTMVMRMDVSQPNAEGRQTITLRFEKIRHVVDLGFVKMEYDSSNTNIQNPRLAQLYGPMLKASFKLTVTNGQITAVDGVKEFWAELAKSNPALAPVAKQMKDQVSETMVKQLVSKSQLLLPAGGKAVKVGDSWTNQTNVPVPLLNAAKVDFTTTLSAVKNSPAGRVAVLAVKGQMNAKTGDKIDLGMAKVVVQSVESTYSGSMDFLVDKGMLQKQTLDMTMKMKMTIESAEGVKQTASEAKTSMSVTIEPIPAS